MMNFPEVFERTAARLVWVQLLLHVSSATAQTVPDAGSLRQQIERDRPQFVPSLIAPKPPVEEGRSVPSGDLAIVVKALQFTGNTLFSAEQLSAAAGEYLNRPLKFSQLQEATAAIAAVYRDAGWVVRVVLPEQDIQNGVVAVQILEAVFGGVKPEGPTPSRIKIDRLVGIVGAHQETGALLNAQAIDRALLIAGDLPGVAVTGSLRQGVQKGETELAISVADKPFFTGDTALDNTGSRGTGRSRLGVNLGLASALGLGEQASVSLSNTEGSAYQRVGFTFPVGYDGWRLGFHSSHLYYRVISPELLSLKVTGSSDSLGMEATYPLVRTQLQNLYFSANYDQKTFDNLANGIVTTRYKASTLALQLNGNRLDSDGGGGIANASFSVVNGDINLDGSPNQAADALTTQTAGNFTKLRYALSRQQPLGEGISGFISFSGQYSGKNLDSSEKYSLGGSAGVRAYPSGEGSGALARLVNLELRWLLPQGFNLTAFYDYGRVTFNPRNDFVGAAALNRMSLKGVGLTMAWFSAKGSSLKATMARRNGNNPHPTDTGKDQDGSLLKNRIWLAAALPF